MILKSNELDMLILQHGKDGTSADSKYVWVKYAQDEKGTGLTDDPTNALYMGIAYNKTEKRESENPKDYIWIKIKGNDGEAAYTIILQNENITFSVSHTNNIALMDQSFDSAIAVFKGTEEVTDFTIAHVDSDNGITVTQEDNAITFSIEAGNKITADYGKFTIPILINGLLYKKEVTWSLAKAGASGEQGDPGEPALSILIGNESQNIPCSYDGHVLNDNLIEITFTGYKGLSKTPCTVSVGVLPSGMTLGAVKDCTISNNGSIILNISKDATLGSEATLTGNIELTFKISGKTMVKYFTWTKTKDGGLSYVYSVEPSTYVLNKTYGGTLDPTSITFNSFYRKNGSDRLPYYGLFTISESTDGAAYTSKYLSSNNECTVLYTPSSSSVKSIRCTLSQADKVSVILDRQTVIVLSDDKLKNAVTTVTTTMNGVSSKVNAVDKKITDKVWQSDITTSINNYDGSAIKTLRDQIVTHETKIGEISTEISDITTTVDGNKKSVEKKIAAIEQDATGFKQTVSSTYETKENASSKYSSFEQRAGSIESNVKGLQGDVTTLKQTDTDIKADLKNTKGNVTSLQSTASGLQTSIKNAQGDINTLKSDASSMKSQISDAQGNISTLQQTSKSLSSQISNNQTEISILSGDPMNYCQLNENTAAYWDFNYDGTEDGRWYTVKTLGRDKFLSKYYDCNGGESFSIEFEISTSVKGNTTSGGTDSTYRGTAIGLYGYNALKKSVGINYSTRTTATAAATATKVSSIVQVPSGAKYFRVFLQTETWGNLSGTLKIRNVIVSRIKAIETRISNTETSIKQNEKEISIRAKSEELDQVKKEAANDATKKANNALSDAKTDTVNKLKSYSTTKQMESAIDSKADSITQEVSKTYTTKTAFNNLYIGGRNLARNTSNIYTSEFSGFNGTTNMCPMVGTVLTDGLAVGDTITIRIFYKYTNIVAASGQTAKAWLQGSGNVTSWNGGTFPSSPDVIISGSGTKELLYTGTITADSLKNSYWYVNFRHDYVQSGSVQWKMFKVEKGNKHSEWTPAPEDFNDTIQTSITNESTSIKSYCDSIVMSATKDTISNDELDDRINELKSSLKLTTDGLEASITKLKDPSKNGQSQLQDQLNTITKYFTFDTNGLTIGQRNNPYKVSIDNTKYAMKVNDRDVMWIQNGEVNTPDLYVTHRFRFFDYVIEKDNSGNINCQYVGG